MKQKIFNLIKENKNLFLLTIFLLLIVGGSLTKPKLVEKWKELQSFIWSYFFPSEKEIIPTEPLEVTLPESEETSPKEKLPEEKEEELPKEPSKPQLQEKPTPPKKKVKPTLSDIQARVKEISEEIEDISKRVAELVEAKEKKAVAGATWSLSKTEKEMKLVEIQAKVKEISVQVEIISRQVDEMVKASSNI